MSTAKEALHIDKWSHLLEPFPAEMIELRPGATNKDKSKALALAYCDKRIYESRLDALFGPDGWAVSYEAWGNDKVFCHLTIAGITKCDVGECDQKDTNAATIAVAQAFKRACSTFGLGRYLYALPQVWAAFDGYKFTEPEKAVAEMYRRGGIGQHSKQEPPASPLRSPVAADEQYEQTARSSAPPSVKPAEPIAKTMADLITPKQLVAIRAIANSSGINAETECMSTLKCRPEELSRTAGSWFIDHLKAATPASSPHQPEGESTVIIQSQIYAITNIGKKKSIDVHAYAMEKYSKPVTAISGEQAAEMIRYLNGVKA